jgi:membrane protein YdbS with pleckstrin-like domain
MIADGEVKQVDPRSVQMERLTSWITTAVIGLVMAGGIVVTLIVAPLWVPLAGLGVWVIVVGLLAWLSEKYPRWAFHFTRYCVSGESIEIRQGVVWRSVTNVPRSRVQHTDVTQGPLMRKFGLAQLVIHTAGTEAATVTLGGLAHATALGIRDHLIRGGDDDAV